VAICLFDGAALPSDLQSVKIIDAGAAGAQSEARP
jgi:hypothetical protein